MKKQRERISSAQLVRSIPIGNWFQFESVDVNITKGNFERRVKSMPRQFIEWRVISRTNQFRVKNGRLRALLNAYPLVKPQKPISETQAEENRRQAKELRLYNIAINA